MMYAYELMNNRWRLLGCQSPRNKDKRATYWLRIYGAAGATWREFMSLISATARLQSGSRIGYELLEAAVRFDNHCFNLSNVMGKYFQDVFKKIKKMVYVCGYVCYSSPLEPLNG